MPDSSPFCFTIAASFTAEPLEPVIRFWSQPLHSEFECKFAPFGQLIQTLLDPSGLFATNKHGLNVLLFRVADLGSPERRQENLAALLAAVEARGPHLAAPLLLVADEYLGPRVADLPSVYQLSASQVDHWYPVKEKYSSQGDQLGAIPYTEDYFLAMGSAIVRMAHAIHKAPHKVLALDCDQTLWQGICGEDGPDGVRLTTGHSDLQKFVLTQRQAGMLLTLSSKNNDSDVVETFEHHPEFPLQLRDITARQVNWNPKPLALEALAAELSLGLDSFIFLDDNPKEISEMDEELPQVLALGLPADPKDFTRFLTHVWAFDRAKVTEADAMRAASYQGVQEFGKALHDAGSLEHFYATLDLEIEIRAITANEVARAAQLTQRTNQFNFTTVRRTEAELQSLLEAGMEVFGIHVRDRFGDYGFTGLLIGRKFNTDYLLDSMMLSCRVLGRGVEHRSLAWLGAHARTLGCEVMDLPFQQTQRNAPAFEFWKTLPVRPAPSALAALRYAPAAAPQQTTTKPKTSAPEHSVDYAFIATSLNTVAEIRRRMRKHPALVLETATETRLASIWQALLDCDAVRGDSNFFDLGGHSLKVVLLLMRVSEEFGVSLGIEDVYAAEVTLERMARRIDELIAFGGVGHEEYTRILASIEAMTEEEAVAAWIGESQTNAHSVSR